MNSYHNTPDFEKLKQHIIAAGATVFTGFSKNREVRVCFSNYPDASIAAMLVSSCGKDMGRVIQLGYYAETCAQTDPANGIEIPKNGRPSATPQGMFSIFSLPMTMSNEKAQHLFPELVAKKKVIDYQDSHVKVAIRELKDGPYALGR